MKDLKVTNKTLLRTTKKVHFLYTIYLVILLLLFFILSACSSKKIIPKPYQKPNVLLLFLDDLDPDFGCYGNPYTQTPNIDNLAQEGALFTRAYASAPVCSPSHSSILTGCYPTTIKAQHHRSTYAKKLPNGYSILTELLSKAGYFTVNFKSNGDRMFNKIYGATAKTDLNFNRGEPENNLESGKEVFNNLQIIDPFNTNTYFHGGEWLKRKEGQPFFAYANIETGKKHGFVPGRKWAKEKGIAVDSSKLIIPSHYKDTDEVRSTLAASLDAVSHVDVEVGKFLTALKESGQAENTLVILLSDHGASLPRHKQCLWKTGLHIPMIIRWPGKLNAGIKNEELASIVDIAPTILSAAKLPIPISMEGLNLLGDKTELRKHIFATRDGMNNFFDASRTIITKKYQYIHHFYPELGYRNNAYAKRTLTFKSMLHLYKKGELNPLQEMYFNPSKPTIELYDLENDPQEIENLSNNVKYQSVVAQLRTELFRWQKTSGDTILDARTILGVKEVPIGTKVDSILNKKETKF
ncbi:arylsulfatase A-like enzyme [Maribacter vaceletii]|uniref:Arylsulfatase A-like enzyme n=1 Tax=Maribacter vaceletii TaxID=1206816 RepID=A0A495EBU6_9FLAO|nr:sulfatase [Maribacter vaceletii]RKR14354.1 arylsulfatase A-like enzyme [Maribacter vaceletii]